MVNTGTPLLSKKFYEGCPGCKLDREKAQSKGMPVKRLFVIAYMVLVNALPISSIYPFIYFMVRDFGIAKATTNITTYAGFIGAAYMLGRFLTATPWGIIADRYGRIPVILCGTLSIIVFNTWFGFSSNFWVAITTRFFLGFCNGMLGTIRAYVSEVCTPEQQATGLSSVSTMWGLGLVVGPAIGGYLAQPSDKYPSVFPSGSLFDSFPYALPCLCISLFAVIGVLPGIWLPESLHKHPAGSETSKKVHEDLEEKLNGTANEDSDVQQAPVTSAKTPVWRNHALIASVFVYCLWGLHDMAYTEILSLWAVSPSMYGGLDFTTSKVGNVLAAAGASLLVFQLSLFPYFSRLLGAINIARVPAVLTLPLTAIYPLIARLDGVALWTVLIPVAMVKSIFSMCIVTGTLIWTNNSVVARERGLANGISMTFMSLFKALGPAGAGTIMTWAQNRMDASFLPGMWSVFTILDVFCLLALIATFEPILPSSVKKPVVEDTEEVECDVSLERAASFSS